MAMLSRAHLISEAVDGAVTIGSAGAMGLIHGRKGEMPKFGPIPADAGIGLGAALLGASGVGGHKVSRHAFNVAKGTLSYFVGSIFAQVGQKMRKNAGELTGAAGSRTVTKGPMPTAMPARPQAPSNINAFDPAELVRRVTRRAA
jgi:hypothetical protein